MALEMANKFSHVDTGMPAGECWRSWRSGDSGL